MSSRKIHAVTGAFGYSGKYISQRLLDKGHIVHTLTNSIERENDFSGRIPAHPFHFDQPEKLVASLKGVSVLYNTYWVRFNHNLFTHADAVKNTLILFECARKAGVERVVHVSITNPDENSRLEYFRGKATLENAVRKSGISYCILRPAVLFGREDILINNIAWMLRKFPVFGLFGNGDYPIQPIYVDDLAKLAVVHGIGNDNCIVDAIGPETFTYRSLVEAVSAAIGKKRPLIRISPGIGYGFATLIGRLIGDVVLTREEIDGLMEGRLAVDSTPTGDTRLTEWMQRHADTLGKHYTSELDRRRQRREKYASN